MHKLKSLFLGLFVALVAAGASADVLEGYSDPNGHVACKIDDVYRERAGKVWFCKTAGQASSAVWVPDGPGRWDSSAGETATGSLWLAGTSADTLSGRLTRVLPHPFFSAATPAATFAGYDLWFCDFNEISQFSVGPDGGYTGPNGAVTSTQTIPAVTDPALLAKLDLDAGVTDANYASTLTTDATGTNVSGLFTWGRYNIGSPATYTFFSDRNLGTDDELHTSVRLGAGTDATGFTVYNPNVGIGASSTSLEKEFGFTVRVRKSPSAQTGAVFFGLSSQILLPGAPLTIAGAAGADTDSIYFGFRVDTTNNIHFVINNGAAQQYTFDTGVDITTSFHTLEIRGYYVNDGLLAWSGGYMDVYVNGVRMNVSGGRAHSVLPTDLSFDTNNGGSMPLSLTMSVVRTATGASVAAVDYIGFWHSRQLQLSTSP
jgi:hypothetical protein